MFRDIKNKLPKLTGALLGCVTYIALIYSSLSNKMDLFAYGYFKHLGLIDEEVVRLWQWLLILVGVLSIFGVCRIFQSSLNVWQKSVSLVSIFLMVLAWSPTLVVWGIIWSPLLLLISILWSVICTWMIQLFLGKLTTPNPADDYYSLDETSLGNEEMVEVQSVTHTS